MRILVTGAGGFVGGHLITNLHRAGHEVIAASHRPWEPPVPVEIDVFDVRDGERFREVMDARRPEGVVHLAAQASVRRSWEASDETFAVNVTGTSHLLEALTDRPETRVLLVGSAQQYGLAAAVWTRDISRAHRIARALRAGNVYVNTYDRGDISLPFATFKQSGVGVDKSLHAIDKYVRLKTTWISL